MAIFKWDGATPDSPVLISPPQGRHVLWSSVLRIPDTNCLVAAYSIEDGSLDIIEFVSGVEPPLAAVCRLQAGNPTDTVARFRLCLVELDGMRTLVIGAATEARVISLWDGTTEFLHRAPRRALSALCPELCKLCMAPQPDSFALAITAALTVQFFREFLSPDITSSAASLSARCTCVHNSPRQPEAPPWAVTLASCVYIRGQHIVPYIRGRRSIASCVRERFAASDTLAVPESKLDGALGPPEAPHIPARWRPLVVGRVVDTMCERGAWDVTGSRMVGLRRRSRRRPDSDASKAAEVVPRTQRECGLSAGSLERWEAWTFDPAEGRISALPLAALQPIASAFSARSALARETPRLPFTRVGPLVSGRTCCLAGFGNTVGLLAPADMVKEGD
ncbi:hypothetical protein EDB86DRAFT_3080134 [Lactarius hatsudake]|nr:hypothetical protein EDB86DRAFT_3080134 [Lactarius hatsudake]